MPRSLIIEFAAILAASAIAPAVAAEEVEHPVYKSWARHPVGTTITLRSVTTSKARTIETTTRTTLVELTGEKAVLEIRIVSDATGKQVETPPQRYEQRRMFPLFAGVKKEDIGKPPGSSAQGEETVSLAGKEFRAQWFDSKGRTDAGETLTRTWMSDEVPGKLLKAVTKVPSASNTTTIELIEIKAP